MREKGIDDGTSVERRVYSWGRLSFSEGVSIADRDSGMEDGMSADDLDGGRTGLCVADFTSRDILDTGCKRGSAW